MSAVPRILIVGRGRVGTALAGALRRAGQPCVLRAARLGPPRALSENIGLVVFCVRDRDIVAEAEWWTAHAKRGRAFVHCSGSLGPEALASLRAAGASVGQMHPAVSLVAPRQHHLLKGTSLLVRGDAHAVQEASRLGRAIGMVPRRVKALDVARYHAAMALAANGMAALAQSAGELLKRAGLRSVDAEPMLHALLRSVLCNIGDHGLPAALSGPIRRGDIATVEAHIRAMGSDRDLLGLYRALGVQQVSMARALGETPAGDLRRIERLLRGGPSR